MRILSFIWSRLALTDNMVATIKVDEIEFTSAMDST